MNPEQNNNNNNRNRRPKRSPQGQGNGQPKEPRAPHPQMGSGTLTSSRGQAVRAQKRSQMDAQRIANQFLPARSEQRQRRANVIDDQPRLRIIGLGGMDGGGSKNMILVEYMNDAVIIDCGNDLGVELPGINYGIADTTYP